VLLVSTTVRPADPCARSSSVGGGMSWHHGIPTSRSRSCRSRTAWRVPTASRSRCSVRSETLLASEGSSYLSIAPRCRARLHQLTIRNASPSPISADAGRMPLALEIAAARVAILTRRDCERSGHPSPFSTTTAERVEPVVRPCRSARVELRHAGAKERLALAISR